MTKIKKNLKNATISVANNIPSKKLLKPKLKKNFKSKGKVVTNKEYGTVPNPNAEKNSKLTNLRKVDKKVVKNSKKAGKNNKSVHINEKIGTFAEVSHVDKKLKRKNPENDKEIKDSSKKSKKSMRKKLVDPVKKPENKPLPAVRQSDTPIEKKKKWINKQRVLVFASRGINHRDRHLMEDLKKMMPHHKPESKMERSKTLSVINEMCEMKNCNKAILFEGRKKQDLYMWLSNVPNGPSVKFLVENVSTMAELKLTGNCLRGSRPLLSFDPAFENDHHYSLLKELLTQIFGVPKHHPKSQPFFDHVYTFSILDNRIWFRNFQILSEDGAMAEIGPRFVLNPVKIFSGSFGGVSLWENSHYMSPAKYRQKVRLEAKNKYVHKVQQKAQAEASRPDGDSYKLTELDDIFRGDPVKKAQEIESE